MTEDSPTTLLFETSSRQGFVAIAVGSDVVGEIPLNESRRHACDLAPATQKLLRTHNFKAKDVCALFVSQGPGSYTGLRVGIMSAKAFAYATGCRILGISTFAALAEQAPAAACTIETFADAQQDRVYVQRFERDELGVPKPTSELRILAFEEWRVRRNGVRWLMGLGLRGKESRLPTNVHLVDQASWRPKPKSLLTVGLRRLGANDVDDLYSLEPTYHRPSAAEEQWDA
ncbi:MAG: tRNA (adenosine(37)-N6)-threonylcarbamoyltransferase complex dimerization subunit type 1 TsaB [Gemmataceae bacterium]